MEFPFKHQTSGNDGANGRVTIIAVSVASVTKNENVFKFKFNGKLSLPTLHKAFRNWYSAILKQHPMINKVFFP